MELYTKKEIIDEREVKIKIWDTAGQEQYMSLTRNFFHNSEGIFLVYDVTNRTSFQQIKHWMQCINDNGSENVRVVLMGNKIDLDEERVVRAEDGKFLAEELKINFFETSALTNENIREAVLDLTSQVLIVKKDIQEKMQISLKEKENENSNQGCKC